MVPNCAKHLTYKRNKNCFNDLTYFNPIYRFANPLKCQENEGCLMLSRDIEREHWAKMGYTLFFTRNADFNFSLDLLLKHCNF